MGEKTTIEIENMRELKQHALDTSKTLKQIINEAIVEKINRERAEMNLPPLADFTAEKDRAETRTESDKHVGEIPNDESSVVDPQILSIVMKFLEAHGLQWSNLSKVEWSDEIEAEFRESMENVYDETVAQKTINMIRQKINK